MIWPVCLMHRTSQNGFAYLFIFSIIVSSGLMKQIPQKNVDFLKKEKLYDHDDPVVILNTTTFYDTILNKDNAWVIEFYNNWCGNCRHFAPTWINFAEDISGWKNVVRLAVVECTDHFNLPICRDFEVTGYPTILMLGPRLSEAQRGPEMLHGDKLGELRKQLVQFLAATPKMPPSWPRLRPRRDLSYLHPGTKHRYVVLEEEGSTLGMMLSLDLSSVPSSEVVRIIHDPSQPVVPNFGQISQSDLPLVFNASGSGQPRLLFSGTHLEDPRDYFLVLAGVRTKKSQEEEKKIINNREVEKTTTIKNVPKMRVYMVDLENALTYTFNHEIFLHYSIKGDQLRALKGFLRVLARYFPGRPPVQKMLLRLREWVDFQQELQTDQMFSYMATTTSDDCFLPPMQEFVGCHGSMPGLRGYPCSLWMLFHTLTVEAYAMNSSQKASVVLLAIREYIRHFFSCTNCSRHFVEMAKDLEREVQFPSDMVLWLWWAHNKVNQRLAGDRNEDPLYPKVQFPPSTLCHTCHQSDGRWDLDAVLVFLRTFYAKDRIDRHTGVYARRQRSLQTDSVMRGSAPGQFSSLDLSLCFVLYCLSAFLLIALYFVFILRRKRRKILFSQPLLVLSTY